MAENPFQKEGQEAPARGKRLEQNQVRLRRQKANRQYTITIPAGVAKSLRCEAGEVFEVFIERGDIILRMIER